MLENLQDSWSTFVNSRQNTKNTHFNKKVFLSLKKNDRVWKSYLNNQNYKCFASSVHHIQKNYLLRFYFLRFSMEGLELKKREVFSIKKSLFDSHRLWISFQHFFWAFWLESKTLHKYRLYTEFSFLISDRISDLHAVGNSSSHQHAHCYDDEHIRQCWFNVTSYALKKSYSLLFLDFSSFRHWLRLCLLKALLTITASPGPGLSNGARTGWFVRFSFLFSAFLFVFFRLKKGFKQK